MRCTNTNCQRELPVGQRLRRGLCPACYLRWRKHGTYEPYVRVTYKFCANANCGRESAGKKRCSPCRRYFKKHGEERPVEWCKKLYYRSSKHRPRKCKVCGGKVVSYGRCNACQMYWQRHKAPRPRYLWDKRNSTCLTCSAPLRSFKKGTTRRGRCPPCAGYWKRTKKDRPRELWGIGLYGWCECGNRADHQVGTVSCCTTCKDRMAANGDKK